MMTEEKAMQLPVHDEFLVCEISLLGRQLKVFNQLLFNDFQRDIPTYNLDHHLCADVTIISHTNKQVKHYLFSLFIYLICLLLCTIIKRVFLKKKNVFNYYVVHKAYCYM